MAATSKVIARLVPYDGKKNDDLANFFYHASLRFKAAGLDTDEKKVGFVLQHLQKPASSWAQPIVEKWTEDKLIQTSNTANGVTTWDATSGAWKDYNEFKNWLWDRSGKADRTKDAEAKLEAIKQGKGSVHDYITLFEDITLQLPSHYVEPLLRRVFMKGLRESVRVTLESYKDSSTWTLKEWKKNAIDLETNKKINALHYTEYTPQKAIKEMPKGWGDPMDVDAQRYAFKKKKGWINKRHQRPKSQFKGTCNKCGKTGHKAAQCFVKKKKPLVTKEQQWDDNLFGGSDDDMDEDESDNEDFQHPALAN